MHSFTSILTYATLCFAAASAVLAGPVLTQSDIVRRCGCEESSIPGVFTGLQIELEGFLHPIIWGTTSNVTVDVVTSAFGSVTSSLHTAISSCQKLSGESTEIILGGLEVTTVASLIAGSVNLVFSACSAVITLGLGGSCWAILIACCTVVGSLVYTCTGLASHLSAHISGSLSSTCTDLILQFGLTAHFSEIISTSVSVSVSSMHDIFANLHAELIACLHPIIYGTSSNVTVGVVTTIFGEVTTKLNGAISSCQSLSGDAGVILGGATSTEVAVVIGACVNVVFSACSAVINLGLSGSTLTALTACATLCGSVISTCIGLVSDLSAGIQVNLSSTCIGLISQFGISSSFSGVVSIAASVSTSYSGMHAIFVNLQSELETCLHPIIYGTSSNVTAHLITSVFGEVTTKLHGAISSCQSLSGDSTTILGTSTITTVAANIAGCVNVIFSACSAVFSLGLSAKCLVTLVSCGKLTGSMMSTCTGLVGNLSAHIKSGLSPKCVSLIGKLGITKHFGAVLSISSWLTTALTGVLGVKVGASIHF
ncbi:uncharacterized protein BXZ73DRAFT_100393 [Epithele typhae]|uniref:uncharacterized protein n=1 Tax=Epithele typhae TaxID=378194 RepID=UPI002007EE2C|nr:uncharacterized protein BXZ73DRAFT_100393 [Epithele typhae]KAH9935924.1 hypothetical protein BXZ73DRAFT_100393 [Epithele typhae]